MDKDRIKGKMDEVKGRVERQAGEWTGDSKAQSEGALDEAKGKVQNTWGKVKDSARDVKHDMEGSDNPARNRDRDVA